MAGRAQSGGGGGGASMAMLTQLALVLQEIGSLLKKARRDVTRAMRRGCGILAGQRESNMHLQTFWRRHAWTMAIDTWPDLDSKVPALALCEPKCIGALRLAAGSRIPVTRCPGDFMVAGRLKLSSFALPKCPLRWRANLVNGC